MDDMTFLDERDRAIRKLRAAAGSAAMAGLSDQEIAAVVRAGVDEVARMTVTREYRERARRLSRAA